MRALTGIGLIALSAALFGALPIFATYAYRDGVNTPTLLLLRFAIAALVMVPVFVASRALLPSGRLLLVLILMGALGYADQSLAYFSALLYASPGLVAILLYLYPALVTLLSVVVLREPITRVRVAALAVALVGTALTIGAGGGGQPLGIALSLLAAGIYSVYILVGNSAGKQASSLQTATVVIMAASVSYGLLVLVQGAQWPQSGAGWLAVGALAVLSTVVAILAFFAGLNRIGPVNASTLSTVEPIVTVLLSALLLAEPITITRLMGGALVLAAVTVLARSALQTGTAPGD